MSGDLNVHGVNGIAELTGMGDLNERSEGTTAACPRQASSPKAQPAHTDGPAPRPRTKPTGYELL